MELVNGLRTIERVDPAMFHVAAPFASASNSSENASPADQGWILPAPALSRSGLTIGLAALCLLIALLPARMTACNSTDLRSPRVNGGGFLQAI